MKNIILVLILMGSCCCYAQTGPGGVGTNDGSSTLKIWYRTDFGVSVTGGSINSITNAAGVSALDISETGTQRPTLVVGAVNGYDEISFSGSNRLETGLTLTTTNFVTDRASSFMVTRSDNTTQKSALYATIPFTQNRFSTHMPWSNIIYFDIGTCCGGDARISISGLTGLDKYSIWSYDALPETGKQLYRNETLLGSKPNTSEYNGHATQRFNIGGKRTGIQGFVGDITEIIIFIDKVNSAERIIIDNYLAAKYGLTLAANDVYSMDDAARGDYDHNAAGIGRVDASNIHDDAQGTGIVHILNPTGLENNEFLMWGHDQGDQQATNTVDVPMGIEARLDRVWRVSEVNTSNVGVDVGSIDMRWDLTDLGFITASDLRLLVDTDNDGIFANEAPIGGATSLGGNIYQFAGITALENNVRFTLGTTDITQTPLPIELIGFSAYVTGKHVVALDWQTASELNNDYFTIQRSIDGMEWEEVTKVAGAGNSFSVLHYKSIDPQPYVGISYYRLKQTDFDGQSRYSPIKSIRIDLLRNVSVRIYPNPFHDQITIEGSAEELTDIKIHNILGQDVTHLTEIISENKQGLIIDLTGLMSGLYTIITKTTVNKVSKQ